MPVLPKNLAAVRNAVASILRSGEHVGMLYSAGDIAAMLRIAADADNNSDIAWWESKACTAACELMISLPRE